MVEKKENTAPVAGEVAVNEFTIPSNLGGAGDTAQDFLARMSKQLDEERAQMAQLFAESEKVTKEALGDQKAALPKGAKQKISGVDRSFEEQMELLQRESTGQKKMTSDKKFDDERNIMTGQYKQASKAKNESKSLLNEMDDFLKDLDKWKSKREQKKLASRAQDDDDIDKYPASGV